MLSSLNLQRQYMIGGAMTFLFGAAFVATAGSRVAGMMLVIAALIPAALLVNLTLDNRLGTPSSKARRGIVRLAAVLLTMGVAWVAAGQARGALSASQRDGTILLISGGVLLILFHLGADYQVWLLSMTVAAASLGSGLLLAPDAFHAGSASWAIAAIAALLGLTATVYPVCSSVIPGADAVTGDRHGSVIGGWLALGAGFLLLALALTRGDLEPHSNVWFVLITGGALALVAGETRRPGEIARHTHARLLAGPVWSGLLVVALIAAGTIAWVAQDIGNDSSWALLAFSIVILAMFAPAVAISSLLQRRSLSKASDRMTILLRQSRTDQLTGLLNRRALSEHLELEIQRASRFNHPLAIGIVDIDDFKSVNDHYGHLAGDLVLMRVAMTLSRELRTIDVLGRYGGEEFLLILPETDLQGAWVAADRVLHAVREMEPIDQIRGRTITVSIGLSAFPEHGRTDESLIAAADSALYAAKRSGKNQIVAAGGDN